MEQNQPQCPLCEEYIWEDEADYCLRCKHNLLAIETKAPDICINCHTASLDHKRFCMFCLETQAVVLKISESKYERLQAALRERYGELHQLEDNEPTGAWLADPLTNYINIPPPKIMKLIYKDEASYMIKIPAKLKAHNIAIWLKTMGLDEFGAEAACMSTEVLNSFKDLVLQESKAQGRWDPQLNYHQWIDDLTSDMVETGGWWNRKAVRVFTTPRHYYTVKLATED